MKRNKITTACEECRTRKKKCDGKRPVCEPCREHTRECRWTSYSGRSEKLTKKYISDLETEVERLQKQQSQHPNFEQTSLSSPSIMGTASNSSPLQEQIFTVSSSSAPYSSQHISPTSLPVSDEFNALNQDIGSRQQQEPSVSSVINESLTKSRNALGTASIGSFVSQIVKNVNHVNQPTDWVQPFQQDSNAERMKSGATINATSGLGYALPPRRTSDTLLATYWQYIHSIFPFVDRIEVESSYHELWTANDNEQIDTLFLYILNLIFALAARLSLSIDPGQRDEVAKTFVTRAQDAHNIDFWSMGNFRSVQALLLVGLHFHTRDPHSSWIAVSMATRIAQSLGLHLPETSENLPSVRAREIVRRVWYGCVVMDCIVTQTYGRPSMLSKEVTTAVPLPLSIDETLLPADLDQTFTMNLGSPSVMDAFIHSVKLYEILADILSHFYTTRSRNDRESITDYEYLLASSSGKTVLPFENRLTQWYETLPSHLQASEAGTWDTSFVRQAVILRQRYLQARILLLRPVLRIVVANQHLLEQPINSRVSFNLHRELMLQCAVACVETAQESIRTIDTQGPSDIHEVGNVSTWMHCILYLYTAATVLLTARMSPAMIARGIEDSINASWDRSLALLQRYEQFGSSAKRIVGILSSLNAHLSERGSQTRPDPQVHEFSNGVGAVPQHDQSFVFNNDGHAIHNLEDNNDQAFLTDFFDLSAFELNDFSWMANNGLGL